MNYQVTTVPDTPVQTNYVLKKGSKIFIDGELHTLGKHFASGGEADLFFLEENYVDVVKVYKSNKLTERKKAKIDKLQTIGIKDDHICSPISKVTDKSGAFIGFTMKKSGSTKSGKTLKQRLMFFDSEGFSGWTRKDIVQMMVMIINLLFKLYSMPNHQILIGDINLDNFIVHSPVDVYLVDVDSVQIDEFPCPVGQDNFVPAELQGVQFANLLRKPEHEMFSIACLLFLCLFNNKNPFACIDGETPAQNIKAGNFPYLPDGTVTDSVPSGNWQYYWAFLPDYMRGAFCNSFSAEPSKRTKISKWKELLERYLSEFDNYVVKDRMANDIIQTRYPLWTRRFLVRCPGCGEYFPEKQINAHSHVCKTCDLQQVSVKKVSCLSCGDSMFLLPQQVKNRNSDELKYCSDCLKDIVVECEICKSKRFIKKYENDNHICPACQNEIDLLKERCGKLISYYKDAAFNEIDFDSRERRLSNIKAIIPELSKFGSYLDSERIVLANILKSSGCERNLFENIQKELLSDKKEEKNTKERLDYWKNIIIKIRDAKCVLDGQEYLYSSLALYTACSNAIQSRVKEISAYIEEIRCKTENDFNNCIKSLFKGNGQNFTDTTIAEQIVKEKGILQKASKLIENSDSYGIDCSDKKDKLSQLTTLVEKEADVFTEIRKQLISDEDSKDTKHLAIWKERIEKLENENVVVANENIPYCSFPIYNSCHLAIHNYIKNLEEYLDACEKERQRLAYLKRKQRAEWGKSILCAIGVFAAIGLLYWLLTWDGVMKILLTVLVLYVAGLVFYLSDGEGWFMVLLVLVAIGCISLIWGSDIGSGIANYFITHFKLYLYIDIGISFISMFVFKGLM